MRIGILFTGDYSWAGGLYYSLNIIKLLQDISLSHKLTVVVITNRSTPGEFIKELNLKNVEIVDLDNKSLFYRLYCKVIGTITNLNFRFITDINSLNLSILYPLISYDKSHKKLKCKLFYWIYDFQHKFLPELFTKIEIEKRDQTFLQISENADNIVVSSFDSRNHFERFYPTSKASIKVFNFVSLIEQNNTVAKPEPNIPEDYFIVCNQFWQHKNHMAVLKALDLLLSQNKKIHIVFTGKYDDERNRKYVSELQDFISGHDLISSVTLTGFISREMQTRLIQNAKAVIQPSFFEGWSTVNEDARALGKFLILSDIPVNREQVKDNVLFFEPSDFITLAEHVKTINQQPKLNIQTDYQLNIKKAKEDLIKLFIGQSN